MSTSGSAQQLAGAVIRMGDELGINLRSSSEIHISQEHMVVTRGSSAHGLVGAEVFKFPLDRTDPEEGDR